MLYEKKIHLFCLENGDQTMGKSHAKFGIAQQSLRPWCVKGPRGLASTVPGHEVQGQEE